MRSSDWSADGCSSDHAASADRADVAEQILEESGFAAKGGGLVAHHGDVHDILHAVPRDVAHRALRIELDDKHHLLTRLGPVETELARFPRNIIPGVLVELSSEEHTSELQSLMRISYAVFC